MAEVEAAMAEAEAKARAMAEAEAEAYAMNEARSPPPVSEELIAQLGGAVDVLLAQTSAVAVNQANAWLMQLVGAAECWPACLVALERSTCDAATHVILSLSISLVRQNRLEAAPRPSAIIAVVRRLWNGATEATPVRRQACVLLCALACTDPHEVDILLDFPFSLSAAEAPLALQVLQDLAHEVLHRPLASKPLSRLLQDANGDGAVTDFIEASAASPGLHAAALQALQQWVHTGIVLSELECLPNCARGLVACLCGTAPELAAEVLCELVEAKECLPARPAAVAWLISELANRVAPSLCGAVQTSTQPAAAAPLAARAAALHALSRVAHSLLRSESAALLGAASIASTLALVHQLVGMAADASLAGAGGLEMRPLWEQVLHPAGWAALRARDERPEALRIPLYSVLLDAATLRATLPPDAPPRHFERSVFDELLRWRAEGLADVLTCCARELGQAACCVRQTAALETAWAGFTQRGVWQPLEAAIACAVPLVRCARDGGACWRGVCAGILRALLPAAFAEGGAAAGVAPASPDASTMPPDAVLHAALEMAAAVAEAEASAPEAFEGASATHEPAVDVVRFALHLCVAHERLAAAASAAALRSCRAAGAAVLACDGLAERVLAAAREDDQLLAGCVWLACSGGDVLRGSVASAVAAQLEAALAPLLEPVHVAFEAACGVRGAASSFIAPSSGLSASALSASGAALSRASLLATRLLPPAPSPPLRIDEVSYTPLPTAPPTAASAAASAVVQWAAGRWLPALHAAAASPARAEEELWEAAAELLAAACAGWLGAGWLRSEMSLPLPASAAQLASARAARDSSVQLLAAVLCTRGHASAHAACAGALADILRADSPAAEAATRATLSDPACAVGGAVARALGEAATRLAVVTRADATSGVPSAALPSDDGDDEASADEVLLPCLQLAEAVLLAHAPLLCATDAGLGALWALGLAPFAGGFESAASAECRSAGLRLLQTLVEMSDETLAHAISAGAPPQEVARAAARGAAASRALRPRIRPLLDGLVSAVSHAVPSSAVEQSAGLLAAIGQSFTEEWRAHLPGAVRGVGTELASLGRALPPTAERALLRACGCASDGGATAPVRNVPRRAELVALWCDFAQVARMGMAVTALGRYV